MTTRNLLQLSKAVMEKIGVIDAFEPPSSVDHQMITERYAEIMETLRADGTGYWSDDEIPLLVFGAVTDLVALHSAPAFGIATMSMTQIEDAEVPIKRRIRRYVKKAATGDETPSEYF